MNSQAIKSNVPIVLEVIGSGSLFLSLFLPYLTFSYSGTFITFNGFSSPLAFLLIFVAIGLSIISIYKYNKSVNKEGLGSSKNFSLFSTISGVAAISIYILAYQSTINAFKSEYYIDISSYLDYGIGFFGFCFGTLLLCVSVFKLNTRPFSMF